MTVRELRAKYLEFFVSKGHRVVPSGSLVPYDVTGRLDESLLFNGAGMVQFKPYFRGTAQPPHPRLVNSQKCLRTGDIESVGDPSHLTFFEMLGNFSFGDYFKREAIEFSWEFLTGAQWLGLDPARLAFTVFEEDDEAHDVWAGRLSEAGIDPAARLFRLGEETNYWPAGSFSNGPPGPCGPNSEMFYWVPADCPPPAGPDYGREGFVADESAGRWLEIWNDVFIQYEWQGEPGPDGGWKKTGMPGLPFRSVDTGMGIERTVAVLNGHGSVYESDAFADVFRRLEALAGPEREGQTRARRIIADHARSAVFCLADGILPAAAGRGYVLRRLVRRAALQGSRALGLHEPFLHHLVEAVAQTYGAHYTELDDKKAVVAEALRNEEEMFRRTLEQGSEILARELDALPAGSTLDGRAAFRLYDTFGFPLEVTAELAGERGVAVDEAGYRAAMADAQERSRGADQRDTVYGGVAVAFVFQAAEGPTPTRFVGYEATRARTRVTGALPVLDGAGRATAQMALALEASPFYAASGGQASDTGQIKTADGGRAFRVLDVVRQDGVLVHLVEEEGGSGVEGLGQEEATAKLNEGLFHQTVEAEVDEDARRATERHHTATHLLHAALRACLGPHVAQAGSLVAPEHLRFDFTHGSAMTAAQIEAVEAQVNAYAMAAEPVLTYVDVPLEDARAMGAMALFGEKYGDRVRVVQVGGMPPEQPSFSRELCGGTHVRNTGEIGLFKIVHEGSAAGGVRRIEAVAGWRALAWAREAESTLHAAADRLKAPPREIVAAIDRMAEALRDERRKRERLAQQGAGAEVAWEAAGAIEWGVCRLADAGPEAAKAAADRHVDGKPGRVVLVVDATEGKLVFVCKAGPEAVRAGAHAGNVVKAAAQAAGGGGGGRADFATAGGRDPGALEAAVQAARAALPG
jgi:alanyl-tRNA synthetase